MDLGAFFLVSIAVIVVPGVDMALVTRQVLLHGKRAGFVTVAGLVNGGLLHAVLALVGLSALLATSATAFTVLRYVGAGYLLYLGVRSLLAARRAGSAVLRRPAARRRIEQLSGVVLVGMGARLALEH